MSLDITIRFKESREVHCFLEHPYWYDNLSQRDRGNCEISDEWRANITHNLGEMASHVPITYINLEILKVRRTDLYHILWRPE